MYTKNDKGKLSIVLPPDYTNSLNRLSKSMINRRGPKLGSVRLRSRTQDLSNTICFSPFEIVMILITLERFYSIKL